MDLIILILVLLLFAALLSAFVLPIVALVISIKTRNRLAALEAALAGRPIVVEPEPQPQPQSQPEPPPPAIEPEPPQPTPTRAPALDAFELESLIGRRGVGWVAVVLILFATAFFMKYKDMQLTGTYFIVQPVRCS